MGWERKRGKIEEFNRLLRGATDTSFAVQVGDLSILPKVRYCITLDSDTRLPRDAARQLIGIITHPLNRADLRSRGSAVSPKATASCSRVSASRSRARPARCSRACMRGTPASTRTRRPSPIRIRTCSARASSPARVSTTSTRSWPRSRTSSRRTRCSRTICSRGSTRASRSSPTSSWSTTIRRACSTHARRQHRWIRGDWQILFWLFPFVPSRHGLKRNRLPLIGRWKILDNLRRSLVAPTLLALLVAGWTVPPGLRRSGPERCCSSLASQLLPLLARLRGRSARRAIRSGVPCATFATTRPPRSRRSCLSLTFLAFHAFDTAHAIGLTLVRLVVTKRRLLEWETAATTSGEGGRACRPAGRCDDSSARWRRARSSPPRSPSSFCSSSASFGDRGAVPSAVDRRAGDRLLAERPAGPRVRALTRTSGRLLRRTPARRGDISKRSSRTPTPGCPPTTFRKTVPGADVARRTSPTNIGMGLLSRSPRTSSAISRPTTLLGRLDLHADARSKPWSGTKDIFSTGTTRRRWRRCIPDTSRPWTAATWPRR